MLNKTGRQNEEFKIRVHKYNSYVLQKENCTRMIKVCSKQLEELENKLRDSPTCHQDIVNKKKIQNKYLHHVTFKQHLMRKINHFRSSYFEM